MKLKKIVALLSIALVTASVAVMTAKAQKGKNYTVKLQHQFEEATTPLCETDDADQAAQAKTKGAVLIQYDNPLPQLDAASNEWSLPGGDLGSTRYSTLDQINTSNVKSMSVRWIQQIIAGGRADFGPRHETMPIVVNGIMYVTDMSGNVYALNASNGLRIWQFTLPADLLSHNNRITNRGVVYGDGNVYVAAGGRMWALDATTGVPVDGFGGGAGIPVIYNAIKGRYPTVTPATTNTFGFDSTIAPQYYNGVVFLTTIHSENNVPGGYVIAVDGKNGNILWQFNDVPQDANDEGWDIAGPTWVGGVRNGGGIWGTPTIDPDLGLLYVSCGNPTPDLDGTARLGLNLFTNSIVALDVKTGKLKWYFQQMHHEIWDYDSSAPTILFETKVGGQVVKGVAQASKNGFEYMLNRQTGRPINPIIEVPVSTVTDVPGEQVWPTQPFPYTAFGNPQEPFVPLVPLRVQPNLQDRIVPAFTPPLVDHSTIRQPAVAGGSLYGQQSFSPQTGLLYVPGIDRISQLRVGPVGATLRPGQSSFGGQSQTPIQGSPSTLIQSERGTLTAYDPSTAVQVWQARLPGMMAPGSCVTAGNLVFGGDGFGNFYAFNATTGEKLFEFPTGNRVAAPPMTYLLNGEQFLTVAAGDIILTFALPKQ
jgi:outer membrane protein assembly factor BamB